MTQHQAKRSRRVVFRYFVPVYDEVEDGLMTSVTVSDDTSVHDPAVIDGGGEKR